jgi:hypothetical protein
MPKGLLSADQPLVCQRQFEPSRVQQQLWSEAYDRLLPQCRHPATGAATARRREKQVQVDGSPAVSCFLEERCA